MRVYPMAIRHSASATEPLSQNCSLLTVTI